MSEEEIIKKVQNRIKQVKDYFHETKNQEIYIEESPDFMFISWRDIKTLQGILDLYNKEKEKNKEAINMLEKHIQHCEGEASGSLHNEICHIALKFDKHLLNVLKEE